MRIVGGIYKGRTLNEFKGNEIRPTSDMVRESLFNILRDRIEGCIFLDLFCGTGAVGIEALSRGAECVVFNDLNRKSVELTKNNLEKVGAKNYELNFSDASTFLKTTKKQFDIIFIDAPYADKIGLECVSLSKSVLGDNGIIIYENQMVFSSEIDGLEIYDRRKYGRAHLTFFRRKG